MIVVRAGLGAGVLALGFAILLTVYAGADRFLSPALARPHRGLMSNPSTGGMPDLLVTLLLVAAILLVADLLLAGGAMTMMGVSAAMGGVANPLAAGALVVLVVALILLLGGPG